MPSPFLPTAAVGGLLMEQGTESDEPLVDTRGQSSSNFSLLFCQQVYGKHKKAEERSLNHRTAIKRYYEAVKVVFEVQSRRAHGRWPRRRTQRPSIFLFMSVQRSAFPGETDPARRDVFVLLYLYASCSLSETGVQRIIAVICSHVWFPVPVHVHQNIQSSCRRCRRKFWGSNAAHSKR